MFIIDWLFIVMYLCAVGDASHRISDTTIIFGYNGPFDCLNKLELKLAERQNHILAAEFVATVDHYCRRSSVPNSRQIFSKENSIKSNYSAFTFNDLRSMEVTYQQLYEWYAPVDLIEEYIAGEQNGIFVNCSDSEWFGLQCEYKLDADEEVVLTHVNRVQPNKEYIPSDLGLYTNGTCYEMNNTDCESVICLDWREICDGKIDCKNGYDEQYCQKLEMNECNSSTERRCYDGQCIDKPPKFSWLKIKCEEIGGHPESAHVSLQSENEKCSKLFFSCGDGHCYDGPSIDNGPDIFDRTCSIQRDRRYLQQMSSSLIILFSHIIVNYTNTQPQFICYNETLCPYLLSNNHRTTIHNNSLTCRAFETFTNRTYNIFNDMVKHVKRLVRSCSLLPLEYNDPHHNCSMYQCRDGSKCFSYHRLLDGVKDCADGEDEAETDVCSRNLTGRFTCDHGTKCISESLVKNFRTDCIDQTDENTYVAALTKCNNLFSSECSFLETSYPLFKIDFNNICNGVVDYLPDSNNNTDESDCLITEWPCDAYFFKCDGVWNCPDGHDELGCNFVSRNSLHCNNSKHFCLQYNTGQPICLSTMNVNDGKIDCVGSFDERKFCRSQYPFDIIRRYRCQNSDICIKTDSICDRQQDCPENDDETIACSWIFSIVGDNQYKLYGYLCSGSIGKDFDIYITIFCGLEDQRDIAIWMSHQKQDSSSIVTKHRLKRQSENNPDYHAIWSCNRGIYVRSKEDPEGFTCFCPDYFYGDRCQYQRKRVSIELQMNTLTSFNHFNSSFILVVLLVRINQSNSSIISHDQFIFIPRLTCAFSFSIQLLYPIDEPYRSLTNHSVHIHAFDKQTLEYRQLWNFPLSFEFLPVQRLYKRLYIPELATNVESKEISTPYSPCTSSCSNNSFCVGHDVSLARDICICPSGSFGRRCLLRLDLCDNGTCNGHGICQSFGIFYGSDDPFKCLCDLEWTGKYCEVYKPRINVLLAQNLVFLSSHVAFLHVIGSPTNNMQVTSHLIYSERLQKETSNLTFIIDDFKTIPDIVFIQFYEHQANFDYYLLYYYPLSNHTFNEKSITNITIAVQSSHRCRSINEIFNTSILAQPTIRRVKNYQRPCLQRHYRKDPLVCFYDDYLMCICDKDNYTHCIKFQTNLDTCDKKWCSNRGMCVKDVDICSTFSRCVCEACAFGSFCQFSSGGYSLSLDGIIGSHILLTESSLFQQPRVVQTAVAIIIILVVSGIILNILSIITFLHKETHEVGCGLYLLTSSIIGLVTPAVLVCKTILLLMGEQNYISCSIIEFLLKWCPASCEWLNACVAFERTVAVKRATQYSRSKSKYFAKWTTPVVLILVGCICMSEFFFRGIVVDQFDNRAWCVLTLNNEQHGLLALYSFLNIFSFIIPLLINLSSAIIIILSTLASKQRTNKNSRIDMKHDTIWRMAFELIRTQILKHKHILIGPIVMSFLSLPRLISTFLFVCTKLDQNPIPSLLAYLVAFLPSMAILFAFVNSAKVYRSALIKSLKIIIPKCIRNVRNPCRNST